MIFKFVLSNYFESLYQILTDLAHHMSPQEKSKFLKNKQLQIVMLRASNESWNGKTKTTIIIWTYGVQRPRSTPTV